MNTRWRNDVSALYILRLGLAALGFYLIAVNLRRSEELRPPIGLALSPNQQQIGVLFEGEPITIFNVKQDHQATKLNIVYRAEKWWLDKAPFSFRQRLAFLTDERLLIVVEHDNSPADGVTTKRLELIEWDIPKDREVSRTEFDRVINWTICESQKLVAIQFFNLSSTPEKPTPANQLKIWDLDSRSYIAELANIKGQLAISNDGSRLAAISHEGMQLFDISQQTFEPINRTTESVIAVEPSSGKTLATSWDMQPNQFKNTETPNLVILEGSNKYALENSADEPKTLIHFFGNGKYIASSMGHGIGVWTTEDGKRIGWYECPYQTVISLAGSSTGDSLAFGRYGEIIYWNLTSGNASKIWAFQKANSYLKRAGGWLLALLCLGVAFCPPFNFSFFTKSGNSDTLSSMFIRLSLLLYAFALAAPALVFTNIDGSISNLRGLQALVIGWQAIPIGQFGWLANILIALGLVAALFRAWGIAATFGSLASILALNTYTMLWFPLPDIDNPNTGGHLTELGIGFYFWLSALISFTVFAMMKTYRSKQTISIS